MTNQVEIDSGTWIINMIWLFRSDIEQVIGLEFMDLHHRDSILPIANKKVKRS